MTEITREQIEQAEGEELCRYVERLVYGDDLTASQDDEWRWECCLLQTASSFVGGRPPLVKSLNLPSYQLEYDRETQGFRNEFSPPLPLPELWNTRDGKPYQNDLEFHVSNWRAKPRDFIGGGNAERELKAELRERGLDYQVRCVVGSFEIEFTGVVGTVRLWRVDANDEAVALCRAACLACLEQRKEA